MNQKSRFNLIIVFSLIQDRMPLLSRRIENFTDSVIRRMTRIANEHGAINLSQGFPDFDPPIELKNALKEAADGNKHQYSITWGAQNFREALAKKQSKYMGIPIDPQTQVVVTCGSTEAMMAAMLTVVNLGDKVIVFSPFYENYTADTILSGAEPIYVHLRPPHFHFDADELEAAFMQNPKALILCNPSNPSGKVFTREELEIIAHFAVKYDTFVITDEVYEHIVYEPYQHVYIASLPGMFERTLSCSSLSKTYSITGWRLGYIIAPEQIIEGARKVHDFLTVGAAAPLQEAAVVALNFEDDYYRKLKELYTEKKEFFIKGLEKLGLKFTVPQGAYYVLVDISEFGATSDLEFCEWLASEVGVAAVPGSSFFKEEVNHLIRFHFAKNKETLSEALKRLENLRSKAKEHYNNGSSNQ
jgi:aspartate/methionine/tyrosine aminotransferase